MNKKGATTDIFLFIIFTFAFLLICGIFIYIGTTTKNQLLNNPPAGVNLSFYNETVQKTMGQVENAYKSLEWLTYFLIIGMGLSILIGSFLVRTYPVFFIVYILLTIIAIIVSVPVSQAYDEIKANPTIGNTFLGFEGSNQIMAKLPLWVAVIGVLGAIILFSNILREEGAVNYASG